MSPAELAAIRARAEAASRAPWVAVEDDYGWGITNKIKDEFGVVHRAGDLEPDEMLSKADAEFCAMARTNVPALLDEVTRWQVALHAELPNEPVPHKDANPPYSLSPKDLTTVCEMYRAEVERLRKALGLVMWMAERYTEAGGSNGPEMREWREAKALADGAPVATLATISTNGTKDGAR